MAEKRNAPFKSVLVVEDDEMIRSSVQDILEMEGYQVYTAANGREALDVLSRVTNPCLILLDLMMPVMNGWEFLEAKSKSNSIANLPVIVVSAVSEQAEKAGVAHIMRKPPDIDTLLHVVEQHCMRMNNEPYEREQPRQRVA